MNFEPIDPPRTFQPRPNRTIVIRHCADVALDADEQVSFVIGGGRGYDVVRKNWGFYATPSVNRRLNMMGLRACVAENAQGARYVLLVETGHEDQFFTYLKAEEMELIMWLDAEIAS
jgi:hypothetical protein